ncbi:hypothetical protein D778_00663 [Xanthomarina gelatinilytica]|uniref:Uncharacterized protein n=1 Tax=Xanthomarina gelatinilytica TaxID=1137281 RepID=M7MHS1_9FLAO|nr:hypothetical protein D778_00663 [Xanthomarina gelatinilytica]
MGLNTWQQGKKRNSCKSFKKYFAKSLFDKGKGLYLCTR